MGVSRSKYKRTSDLYVDGTECELKDGSVIWLQVLNPFELDEARMDAQTARARLVLALERHGSQEQTLVHARFSQVGREGIIAEMLEAARSEALMKAAEEIANDPDWTERLEITKRTDELVARPVEDPERQLLDEVNREYLKELQERVDGSAELRQRDLESLDDEALRKQFHSLYIDRRGNERAMAEFRITELWYGARVCNGEKGEDGTWDHAECEGHRMRVWETKDEVRSLPAQLQILLTDQMGRLAMSVREAKALGRESSSSGSSPLPKQEEGSTPSTPAETPATAPGISS